MKTLNLNYSSLWNCSFNMTNGASYGEFKEGGTIEG